MNRYRVSLTAPNHGYVVRELCASSDHDVREQVRNLYVGARIVSIILIVDKAA